MLNIRPVWKADEFKRFGELEEKYHYMGETHSGGDTLRLVSAAREIPGLWMSKLHYRPLLAERPGSPWPLKKSRVGTRVEGGSADPHIQAGRPSPARHVRDAHDRADQKRDFAYCEDVRTRRCNANIIGAMMLARTPAFVFMAKRGVANSQAFKEELQSDHALPLRMVVDAPSN